MEKKFAKYMPMGNFPEKCGHALQVSVTKDGRERTRLFVEMAPQTKPKPPSGSTESPFDWQLKKFISLDENEMGLIMACFRGREKEVKIVHKYPQDAPAAKQKLTGLTVKAGEYKGKKNWGVSLMQKMGEEAPETFNIFLSAGEVEVLMVILQYGIQQAFGLL